MKVIRPFIVSDTSLVSCNVPENDYTRWAIGTTYALGDNVLVCNPSSDVTLTIAAPCVVTWTAHGLANGTVVVFKTTGLLPTGLTANVAYYVVNQATNTFQVSLTLGGTAIDTSGIQSGLHSVLAMISPASSIVTFTTANPSIVSWVGHGFLDDEKIVFYSTGTLPTGILPNTPYFIVRATLDTFQITPIAGRAGVAVTGAGSGTHFAVVQHHRVYESLSADNIGYTPHKNPTKWLYTSVNNRWEMFDTSVTSQTANLDSIITYIKVAGRADSVALVNTEATSVTVTASDAVEGVVYGPTTYQLVDTSAVSDWWTYFFEPIIYRSDWVASDLPQYSNLLIKVELTRTGQVALCGGLIVGLSKLLGATQYGANVGIQDYSVKQRDDFGNYDVLERAFSKRGNFTLFVNASQVDSTTNILAQYRATPCIYVGTDDYQSSLIYGFYKDFSIDISYPTVSVCSLEIEGLT